MPTGQGEDEIDEDTVPAAAVTGAAAGPGRNAAAGPGRRFQPAAPPRDLQQALASIADDEYGSKIFENLGVQDITPELVKGIKRWDGDAAAFRARTAPFRLYA